MSERVAQAQFDGGPTTGSGAMSRQVLPLDRLLMSFLETRTMTAKLYDAEVVLVGDATKPVL